LTKVNQSPSEYFVNLPEDYFYNLYQSLPRQLAFKPENVADFDNWSAKVRQKLRELLKVDGALPTPQVEVCERLEIDGLQREYILIHDEPFGPIPAYVLRPVEMETPAPGVMCLHGHGGYFAGKDMVVANPETHAIAIECGEALNYPYGVQLARAGFVTISPDAYNFGERVMEGDRWAERHLCNEYQAALINTGYSSAGITTRGNLLVLNYLLSRPDVAGDTAGCVGLSYGGFQTLLLAGVEPRIAAAVVSGALSNYVGARTPAAHCGAQTIPGVLQWFDQPDVAFSIAPRPVLYEMMQQDCCFNFDDSMKLYKDIEAVYGGIDAADRIECDVADTDHRYIGDKVPEFLRRYLA